MTKIVFFFFKQKTAYEMRIRDLSSDVCSSDLRYVPWFLRQVQDLVVAEEAVRQAGLPQDREAWLRLKQLGFSDARLGELTGVAEEAVRAARKAAGVTAVYKRIDTCAGEFASDTPYMYAAYESGHPGPAGPLPAERSEEHTPEQQAILRISYAVSCLQNKSNIHH